METHFNNFFRIQAKALPGRVAKILTWRYVPDPDQPNDTTKKKSLRQRPRELFVKWHGKPHWDCAWISELQVCIFFLYILNAGELY